MMSTAARCAGWCLWVENTATHIHVVSRLQPPQLEHVARIGSQKWIENDESSSDDASTHGKNDDHEEEEDEEEKEGLQVPLRPSAHPPRSNIVDAPPRPPEPNRKPGSPVFQHGKAMRGRNHVSVASQSEASSLRGKATNASRITYRSPDSPTQGVKPTQHREVSPSSGVERKQPELRPRPFSLVDMASSPKEGEAPADRGTVTTPSGVSHEAAENRRLMLEEMKLGVSGAGHCGVRSLAAEVPLSNENISAAKMAMGLPGHEKGGKFDMLSSNVSFSDSEEGSSSEIDVCDFLEASSSSVAGGGPNSGSGDGSYGQHGGDGVVGDMARRYLNSEGDDCDRSDGGIPQGLQYMGIDEQDIAFLAESRELREAMLGVEDLHFGETKELCIYSWEVYLGKQRIPLPTVPRRDEGLGTVSGLRTRGGLSVDAITRPGHNIYRYVTDAQPPLGNTHTSVHVHTTNGKLYYSRDA